MCITLRAHCFLSVCALLPLALPSLAVYCSYCAHAAFSSVTCASAFGLPLLFAHCLPQRYVHTFPFWKWALLPSSA